MSTPKLIEAAADQDVELVLKLVAAGVDVNEIDLAGDWCGYDAVDVAARLGNQDILQILLRAGSKNKSYISQAMNCGHGHIIEAWLDDGGNVNQPTSSEGYTLLMQAARSGLPMVKLLVDRGADVNIVATDGTTALGNAQESGNADVVAYLHSLSSPHVRVLAARLSE